MCVRASAYVSMYVCMYADARAATRVRAREPNHYGYMASNKCILIKSE